MALSNQSILAHIENWRMTLENREVDAATVLDSIADIIINGKEPAQAAASKIVVTKYAGEIGIHSDAYDGADDWHISAEGTLEIYKGKTPIANYAAGEWSSVKIVEG